MSCLSWSTLRLCLKINKSVCLSLGLIQERCCQFLASIKETKTFVDWEFDCPEVTMWLKNVKILLLTNYTDWYHISVS